MLPNTGGIESLVRNTRGIHFKRVASRIQKILKGLEPIRCLWCTRSRRVALLRSAGARPAHHQNKTNCQTTQMLGCTYKEKNKNKPTKNGRNHPNSQQIFLRVGLAHAHVKLFHSIVTWFCMGFRESN